MKKYGIAKRGFGRALRQSFGVGGIVVKKIFKKAAKENIEKAKKLRRPPSTVHIGNGQSSITDHRPSYLM